MRPIPRRFPFPGDSDYCISSSSKQSPQLCPGSTPQDRVRASREGAAADPGDALPPKGEPLSAKCHQSPPRPDDSGPSGIGCPSLTAILQARDREKEMSRGLEARGRGGRRDAAPRELRVPERLAGRRGLASPPRSGGRGQRGQPWKGRPPPRPLGREATALGRPGLRTPIQPEARPRPPPPSARRGVPASPRRPAGRPAATPGRTGKDEAQGPRGPRKAEGRPAGLAPVRGTGAPGGHRADPRADPRPRRFPVQAAAVQPAPHLISRRVRAAAPGTNQCSSLAAGRDAGAAAPHTIPARLPARRPVRPGARSGFSLASRRTTEQPSCAPSPLLRSSLPPSLPPSLPRSHLSPHLPPQPLPPSSTPPSPPTDGWERAVGQSGEEARTSSPPPTATPAHRRREGGGQLKRMEEDGVTAKVANQQAQRMWAWRTALSPRPLPRRRNQKLLVWDFLDGAYGDFVSRFRSICPLSCEALVRRHSTKLVTRGLKGENKVEAKKKRSQSRLGGRANGRNEKGCGL